MSVSIPKPAGVEIDMVSDEPEAFAGVLNQSSDICCVSGESPVTSCARGAVAPLATSEMPSSRVA